MSCDNFHTNEKTILLKDPREARARKLTVSSAESRRAFWQTSFFFLFCFVLFGDRFFSKHLTTCSNPNPNPASDPDPDPNPNPNPDRTR